MSSDMNELHNMFFKQRITIPKNNRKKDKELKDYIKNNAQPYMYNNITYNQPSEQP